MVYYPSPPRVHVLALLITTRLIHCEVSYGDDRSELLPVGQTYRGGDGHCRLNTRADMRDAHQPVVGTGPTAWQRLGEGWLGVDRDWETSWTLKFSA